MSPSGDVETKAAYEHQEAACIRFSRYGTPVIHEAGSFHFEIGKGETLRDGRDVAVIAPRAPSCPGAT